SRACGKPSRRRAMECCRQNERWVCAPGTRSPITSPFVDRRLSAVLPFAQLRRPGTDDRDLLAHGFLPSAFRAPILLAAKGYRQRATIPLRRLMSISTDLPQG